ncbi:MAG: hypothetical protein J6J43_02860 [Oscillospiraceae bacterium]|nr:hypothetical protein [Oscillospiraceae bacterium]
MEVSEDTVKGKNFGNIIIETERKRYTFRHIPFLDGWFFYIVDELEEQIKENDIFVDLSEATMFDKAFGYDCLLVESV